MNDCYKNKLVFSINHRTPHMALSERKNQTSKFQKYLKEVFQDSLITGFPQIANSHTRKKIFSKAGILIFCFMGFLYQTCDFLKYYFEYPVTVNVEESSPFEVTPPAFTFCNHNRIRRRAWCEQEDVNCEIHENVHEFCKEFSRYCHYGFNRDEMKTPRFGYFRNFDWAEAEKFSPTEKLPIAECALSYGQHDKLKYCKYRLVPFTRNNNDPSFCHTVNSLLDKPHAKEDIYPNSLLISMRINTYPHDYLWYIDPVLLYVTAHDSRHLMNPFREGHKLIGGGKYDAYISLTQIERLPPPYSTNCYDYIKSWKENNGSGPTTQAECIQYCNLASVLSMDDCIDEQISISHSERLCPPNGFNTYRQDEKSTPTTTDEIIKNCTRYCQPACFEKLYEVEYRKSENPHLLCWISESPEDYTKNISRAEYCDASDIEIRYYFRKFRLKRHIYQPKYNSVELFSYVGGYMGLWLGISLVSIFDLCESLGKVMHFSLKQRNFKTSIIK